MPAKSLILKDRDFPDTITLTMSMKGKHIRFVVTDRDGEHAVTVVWEEYKIGLKYLREPRTKRGE